MKKVSTASLHGDFALYDAFRRPVATTIRPHTRSGIEQIQRWINRRVEVVEK